MNAVGSVNPNATACPRCKREGVFGQRLVTRSNIVHRCSACGAMESESLPRFPKKIIYLDQCALSSIVKRKDTFWTDLHKKLDGLTSLQLIACPWSRLHREESMLTQQWRDQLQGLYKQLAGDDRFLSPDDIELAQLKKVLHCYLGQPEASNVEGAWEEAFKEDPHRFTGDMVVTCQFPANQLIVSSVSQRKQAVHGGMQEVGDYWKQNPQSFKKAIEAEIEGYGRSLIAAYRELTDGRKRIEGMLSGELLEVYRSTVRQGKFDPHTPPGVQPGVRLVHWLACEVIKARPSEEDPVAVVEDFFKSEYMRSAPFMDISSHLWATIAQQTQSDKMPRRPKPSDSYDAKAVSYYAPYCDAMFLDNEFRKLSSQGNVDVPGRYHVTLFSENNRDEFMVYLDNIQRSGMSSEHIGRLALIFPEWAPLLHSAKSGDEKADTKDKEDG